MNRFLLCLLSLVACANGFAADKSEKPLSVTFTQGPNGAPRKAIFIAGEQLYFKAVAKDYPVPKSLQCNLSMRYYIVDNEDKIAYSHRSDKLKTVVALGQTTVKLLLDCAVTTRLEAGEYNFVTEMKDDTTGQVFRNRQSFLVLPWDEFVVSQLCFSSMTDPVIMLGPSFEVGQKVILHAVVQAPQTDDEGNWRCKGNIWLLNKAGKNIDRNEYHFSEEVPSTSLEAVPVVAPICITTPGDYLAVVEVKDLVSGKVSKQSIPFRVFDSLSGIPRAPTL
ncbi:MAG: hypothetical protein ACO1RA_20990 [Planctomycetaceae bacterium]